MIYLILIWVLAYILIKLTLVELRPDEKPANVSHSYPTHAIIVTAADIESDTQIKSMNKYKGLKRWLPNGQENPEWVKVYDKNRNTDQTAADDYLDYLESKW